MRMLYVLLKYEGLSTSYIVDVFTSSAQALVAAHSLTDQEGWNNSVYFVKQMSEEAIERAKNNNCIVDVTPTYPKIIKIKRKDI